MVTVSVRLCSHKIRNEHWEWVKRTISMPLWAWESWPNWLWIMMPRTRTTCPAVKRRSEKRGTPNIRWEVTLMELERWLFTRPSQFWSRPARITPWNCGTCRKRFQLRKALVWMWSLYIRLEVILVCSFLSVSAISNWWIRSGVEFGHFGNGRALLLWWIRWCDQLLECAQLEYRPVRLVWSGCVKYHSTWPFGRCMGFSCFTFKTAISFFFGWWHC